LGTSSKLFALKEALRAKLCKETTPQQPGASEELAPAIDDDTDASTAAETQAGASKKRHLKC
jgi:hypothetical protein